jgi:hypothetical protein
MRTRFVLYFNFLFLDQFLNLNGLVFASLL